MAFSGLWCAAIWALGLASWCHCATALGNPELSGHGPARGSGLDDWTPLVGPGFGAPECKIVGIGGLPARRLLRLAHLIGDALALAIGYGLFLAVEAKRELLLHVAGTGPAHQRLDRSRLLGLIIELPFTGLRGPRLHRVFGGLKDTCSHGCQDPWICDMEAVGGSGRDSIETAFRNLTGDSEAWRLRCPDRYSHYAAL